MLLVCWTLDSVSFMGRACVVHKAFLSETVTADAYGSHAVGNKAHWKSKSNGNSNSTNKNNKNNGQCEKIYNLEQKFLEHYNALMLDHIVFHSFSLLDLGATYHSHWTGFHLIPFRSVTTHFYIRHNAQGQCYSYPSHHHPHKSWPTVSKTIQHSSVRFDLV